MKAVVFWMFYPSLWFLSILPFRLLYILSDICDKTEKERLAIEKKFYKHLCDMFLEMIKSMSISKEELIARFEPTNIEVARAYEQNNNSILLMLGHYASYEWIFALQLHVTLPGYAIYKKIKHKQFDNLVHKIRGRWNTYLMDMKNAIRTIKKHQQNNVNAIYGFVADQSPKRKRGNFWLTFLGQEVPFFKGAERMAKEFEFPVLYFNVEKVKRGVLSMDAQTF